ncbi:MAG: hypothetical protein EPO39_08705 [Candidatus Manganitrophaceae bacterium]|nr:MAG: hypothetical protein EPO39_08705 [Candidatus Manganitrophaceae bacterium]
MTEEKKGHTPGPLYLDRGSSVSPLCARVTPYSDGFIVASFNREEDARRMVVLWNICEGIGTSAFEAGVIGELTSALREMLEYAEARNTDKKARTVNLKFSRLTLEMWIEKTRAALSSGEALLRPTEPETSSAENRVAADPIEDRIHEVEYNTTHSSGRPRWSCYRCNDTIIRLPHVSDQDWDQAVAIFKEQPGVL